MKIIKEHKYYFTAILIFLLPMVSQAQITLQEAIKKGLAASPEVKSSHYAYQAAQWQLKSEKSDLLPVISAGAGLRRNLIIPITPVPMNAFSGSGNNSQLTYLKFGTNWQSNLGLSLKYDLVNPMQHKKVQIQQEQAELAGLNFASSKKRVRFAVTKAYVETVLAKQQLKYAVEDTTLNASDLKTTRLLYSKGKVDEQNFNTARNAQSQSLTRYYNTRSVYEQARLELLYQMGGNPQDTLPRVNDSLPSLLKQFQGNVGSVLSPKQSIGYLKLKTNLKFDRSDIWHLKRMFLPRISLGATYGTDYYNDQAHFFNSSNWYGNSSIGLNITLPISENISYHQQIKSAKATSLQTQMDILNFVNRRKTDISKTLTSMEAYEKIMAGKNREMKTNRRNYFIERSLYEKGRVLPDDLQKSLLDFEKSKVDYLQSIYNYILARIHLMELIQN